MNAAQRRRRVRAGRSQLIADIGALRLRGESMAPEILRDAINPHLRFAQFQILRRHISTLLRCNP